MIQYALPESANTRVRVSPTILGMVTMKATGNHPFWDVHRESRNFPPWNQCSNMTMVCLQMNPKIYQWQRHLAPTVTAKLLQFSPTLPPIRQQQQFQAVSASALWPGNEDSNLICEVGPFVPPWFWCSKWGKPTGRDWEIESHPGRTLWRPVKCI